MKKHKFSPTKIIQRLFAGGSLTFSAIIFDFPDLSTFPDFREKMATLRRKKEQWQCRTRHTSKFACMWVQHNEVTAQKLQQLGQGMTEKMSCVAIRSHAASSSITFKMGSNTTAAPPREWGRRLRCRECENSKQSDVVCRNIELVLGLWSGLDLVYK